MSIYAIGIPGQKIRFAMAALDKQHAISQLQANEVYLEIDEFVDGTISEDGATFTPLLVDMELEQVLIRSARTALLSACDWTQTIDAQLTTEQQQAWATYRQALRDIPDDQPNVLFDDVVWPEPPQ
ncbi:tail fiber assembly protein [Sphingobium chungangianum]